MYNGLFQKCFSPLGLLLEVKRNGFKQEGNAIWLALMEDGVIIYKLSKNTITRMEINFEEKELIQLFGFVDQAYL
jgi:hypothetical protein